MNSKKIIITGLIIFVAASCTHYIYISRSPWQQNTIIADGEPTEWTTPLKYYDQKSKLQYAVTNDYQNLYFCIKATEEQTQIKMLRAGMQIWIDTTGKNEHRIGILFPMANTKQRFGQNKTPKERNTEENTEERKTEKKHDVSGYKKKFLNEYKEMRLSGFKPPINGMNPIQSNYGIVVNVNWDTFGIMTYEVIVPFKTFYKDEISASDSLKLMGISIILNALPMPQGSGGGGSGGRHGGGGGMGGGGMNGGGGGMGSGGMSGGSGRHGSGGGGMSSGGGYQGSTYLYDANTIKKIFQLAVKKKTVANE